MPVNITQEHVDKALSNIVDALGGKTVPTQQLEAAHALLNFQIGQNSLQLQQQELQMAAQARQHMVAGAPGGVPGQPIARPPIQRRKDQYGRPMFHRLPPGHPMYYLEDIVKTITSGEDSKIHQQHHKRMAQELKMDVQHRKFQRGSIEHREYHVEQHRKILVIDGLVPEDGPKLADKYTDKWKFVNPKLKVELETKDHAYDEKDKKGTVTKVKNTAGDGAAALKVLHDEWLETERKVTIFLDKLKVKEVSNG